MPDQGWKQHHANEAEKALDVEMVQNVLTEFAENMGFKREGLPEYGLAKIASYVAQVARAQALGFDPELLRMTDEEADQQGLEMARMVIKAGKHRASLRNEMRTLEARFLAAFGVVKLSGLPAIKAAAEKRAVEAERERRRTWMEDRKRQIERTAISQDTARACICLADDFLAALDSDREGDETPPPQKQCDSCGHDLRGRGWTHRGDEVWCLPCVYQVEGKPAPDTPEGEQ